MHTQAHALGAIATALLVLDAAHATELQWGHTFPVDSSYHKCALEAASAITDETNGDYSVLVYPGATLGDARELSLGLDYGNVDLAFLSPEELESHVGSMAAISSPYFVSGYQDWVAFISSSAYQHIVQEYERKTGHSLPGLLYRGQRHLLSSGEIVDPSELREALSNALEPSRSTAFIWNSSHDAVIHPPGVKGFGHFATELPVHFPMSALLERTNFPWTMTGVLSLTAHSVDSAFVVLGSRSQVATVDRKKIEGALARSIGRCALLIRAQEIRALYDLQRASNVEVVTVDIGDLKALMAAEKDFVNWSRWLEDKEGGKIRE